MSSGSWEGSPPGLSCSRLTKLAIRCAGRHSDRLRSQITDTPGGIYASNDKGSDDALRSTARGDAGGRASPRPPDGRIGWADGFFPTIPREVLAQDLNTGQPYFAPPIPWGHYAKDGPFDHYYPKAGHFGFLHHGCKELWRDRPEVRAASVASCGHGCGVEWWRAGCGLGGQVWPLVVMAGGGSAAVVIPVAARVMARRRIKDCGLCKNKGCGLCRSSAVGDPMYVMASSQSPSPQVIAPVASSQIIDPSGWARRCFAMVASGRGAASAASAASCTKAMAIRAVLAARRAAAASAACSTAVGEGCGACGGKGCGKCGLFNHGGDRLQCLRRAGIAASAAG